MIIKMIVQVGRRPPIYAQTGTHPASPALSFPGEWKSFQCGGWTNRAVNSNMYHAFAVEFRIAPLDSVALHPLSEKVRTFRIM